MISIIMPAYNEEKRVGRTIKDIADFFEAKNQDYEIVVAVDGCKDRTREVVERFSKNNGKVRLSYKDGRSGKGGALLRGFLYSKGEKIVFADADGAADPEQLLKLANCLDKYDVAWGKRIFGSKEDEPPLYRVIVGKSYGFITMFLFFSRFYDVQSGYKAFRRDVLEEVFPKLKTLGIEYDIDLLANVRKAGYRIRQLNILWRHVEGSPSYNPINHFYTFAKELIKIRVRTLW
ncbi:MAG TPA: glycosyltransferase [archaeon]|nr:glycosyltransferase [archaeon]